MRDVANQTVATILQLEHHGTIQIPTKEQEVYPVVMSKFIEMNLAAAEREPTSEGHNEVLHIVYDIAFYHSFIHVLVVHTQLLYIDIVKQIFILEHPNGTICLLVIWDGSKEVVGHLVLMVIEVLLLDNTR